MDFVSQGRSVLGSLEEWLLDDEQKQILDQSEWAAFFLAAAAYLCDIGLRDGDGKITPMRQQQTTPKHLDSDPMISDPYTNGRFRRSRYGQSQNHCRNSRCIDPPADQEKALGLQNISFADAPIDVTLLAGFLRLSKALALKTYATSKEINSPATRSSQHPD